VAAVDDGVVDRVAPGAARGRVEVEGPVRDIDVEIVQPMQLAPAVIEPTV
jgi:hypothetical protein